MLKNILNINGIETLGKVQQKTIKGGGFGDVGLPDVGPNGDGFDDSSEAGRCSSSGFYWNAECNRCEDPRDKYFAAPGCLQIR